MPDLGILGLEFENNIAIFNISAFEFALLRNFLQVSKCLNVGPKSIIWVFLGWSFKKLLSYFKS